MKFTDFQLDSKILRGIEKAGFVECTDVQTETLKNSLLGRDVLVQSQTGTGKTAAFVITMYDLLLKKEDLKNKKVLILAPTRELVLQIEKEAKLLGSYLDFKIGSFYGGVGYNQQENLLKEGVDILVGTPGRLIDFAGSGKIKFGEIGILVIDEADRMFDMGFYPDIKRMVKRMVPPADRISMLFSATLSTRVKNLAWEYMNDPVEINMSVEQITVDKIDQILYHVGAQEKIKLLLGLLKQRNPENVLIFTNTKHDAVKVAGKLTGNGYECDFIIGDLPQKRRTKIIDNIKSGKLKCLVATDVAARGLHINDLDVVINYDIPEDFESYVHRIGRTARAGKSGMAITLACEKYVYGLEAIEAYIKMKIPVEWAGEELFIDDLCSDDFIRDFMRSNKSGKEMPRKTEKAGQKNKEPKAKTEVKFKATKTDEKEKGKDKKVSHTATRINKTESEKTDKNKKKDIKTKTGQKLPEKSKKDNTKTAKEIKNKNLDERMKYYKEKYGEEFTVRREINTSEQVEKKSLFERIKSIFIKK